ncbi:MAG: protoporphyrinogen oxidase [Kineosporiaceae bacterium]
MRTDVAVLGAGVAGLTAAWELARAGVAVTVLDPAASPGGPVATGTVAGVTCDLGAESFLVRRPEMLDLLAAVGAGDDVVAPRAAAASVLRDGRRHDLPRRTLFGVPADPAGLAPLLRPDEVARAAAEVPFPVTADETVAEFVGRRLGRAVVDHVVDPLLGGVYAGGAGELSAEATLPQLVEAVRGGRGLREAVAGVLRGSGEAGGAPFAGLRGGVGRVPRLLVEGVRAAGGEVRLLSGATGLSRAGGGWRVATATGALDADAVVVATPAGVAGGLLRATVPAAADLLAGVRTADVAVVAVAVDAAALPDVAAGDSSGLLVPAVEGRARGLAVKAVTYASAKWSWIAEQDPALVVVRASVGRAGDPAPARLPDRDLVSTVAADLAVLLGGGTPLPVRDAVVQRWPGSLPQYAVGHAGMVRTVRAAVAAVPGLALAGNALAGVGLPACVATGREAAGAVQAHLTGEEATGQ